MEQFLILPNITCVSSNSICAIPGIAGCSILCLGKKEQREYNIKVETKKLTHHGCSVNIFYPNTLKLKAIILIK